MYLGSDFHRFWARCGRHQIHPDDDAHLKHSPFDHSVLPCPFDGPLEMAKVVICLANPKYDDDKDRQALNALIMSMRSGEDVLPEMFADFYRRTTGPIGLEERRMRHLVSILNVCPYASKSMEGKEVRVASGLPSVWTAQKYLREVLMPRAQTGNIYLVVLRKLQLWGLTADAEEVGNIRVVSGRELSGVMSQSLGEEIGLWLVRKGYVPLIKRQKRHHDSQ